MTKQISETAFASQVEDLLRRFQWRFMHMKPAMFRDGTWSSRMNEEGKGFPDYCAVHAEKKRLLFAELKDQYSKPSDEQGQWLEDLRECVRQITYTPIELGKRQTANQITLVPSYEVYLWRPSDVEEIAEILE